MLISKEFSLVASSGGGGSVNTGVLQIAAGVPLDGTLRVVEDQAGAASKLLLSTAGVELTGTFSLNNGTKKVSFDYSGINTSDKTITIPNTTGTMALTSDIPTIAEGVLQISGGVAMSGTLTAVTDQGSNTSPLQLSTTSVKVDSELLVNGKVTSQSSSSAGINGFQLLNGDNTTTIFKLTRNAEAGVVIQSLANVSFSVGNAFSSSSYELQLTSTGLLAFGAASNAYPALKRSSTTLEVKLADDSAYTGLTAKGFTIAGYDGITSSVNDMPISSNYVRAISSSGWHIGDGSYPPATAILELKSTTKGFLPPRMTGPQATTLAAASPAQGLLIFVTSTDGIFTAIGWWGYDGTNWNQL